MDGTIAELQRLIGRQMWTPVVCGDGNHETKVAGGTEKAKATKALSHFNGDAWLRCGEGWPLCGQCCGPNRREPLLLLLQLDLDALPAATANLGSGLLQLFYCVQCDNFAPFSAGHLVRLVPKHGQPPLVMRTAVALLCCVHRRAQTGPPASRLFAEALGGDGGTAIRQRVVGFLGPGRWVDGPRSSYKAVSIRGWREGAQQELPNQEELGDTSMQEHGATAHEVAAANELSESDAYTDMECFPAHGDKLGGYPRWVQGVEYPTCRRAGCGETMRLVFQIGSEDNIPLMWGDCGIGHITQCPTHTGVLAFGWACG